MATKTAPRWFLLALLGVLACSDANLPPPRSAPGGDGGADTAGSSPAAFIGVFIGVWEYQSGQEKLECPAVAPLMGDLAEATLTFQMGSDAPLLLAAPGCNLKLDVQGNKTVLRPDQSCTGRIANTPVTFRPQTFTLEVNGDGKGATAQQSGLWNVTMMPAGQPARACTLTSSGTLTKR